VEVLAVDDAISGGPLERAEQLGDAPAGVQAVGWTAAEWCAERARGNPIAIEAQERGIWLKGSAASLGC